MRIAFVSTILGYPFGGADWLWTESAGAAIAAGHQVFIAVSPLLANDPRIGQLASDGAVVHLRRHHTAFRGRLARLQLAIEHRVHARSSLLGALDSFRPDVVILCQGGTYDFLVEDGLSDWLGNTHTGYVLICQSNAESDAPPPSHVQRAQQFVSNASCVVFVSNHNRNLAERQLGMTIRNAARVQNPVRLSRETPVAWPRGGVRLAAVGRLEPDKGIDVLIDALAEALRQTSGWNIDLFGQGRSEADLRRQISRLGLDQHVHFAGFVSDVESVWRDHQLLILPSRREGCSLAMLEALACGRPVLATRVGGVEDWIEPGVNGFVCPECTVPAMAASLREAWAARDCWPMMGDAAFRTSRRFEAAPGESVLSIAIADKRVPSSGRVPR